MFERYTEKARRVIFFARYEASQFGSPYIETEHVLLGLLRENKVIALKLLGAGKSLDSENSVETIRKKIESLVTVGTKLPTSVDLPLSNECKRVLAYAAEEAERLSHRHIGTEHLLLGLLREKGFLAAQLLNEAGLTLDKARREIGTWPEESGVTDTLPALASSASTRGGTLEIHGRKFSPEYIREVAKGVADFAWIRRLWKPLDIVVDNELGGICFDLTVADGKRFELVPAGWTKEPCAICSWPLTADAGPEQREGFTNGRRWICVECYYRFVAKKKPGAA
jgi:hypothetical protein